MKTVQTHSESVRQKYQVHSRTDAAVVFAMQTLRAWCRPGQCPGLRSCLEEADAAAGASNAFGKRSAQIALAGILASLEREGRRSQSRKRGPWPKS